MPGTLGFPLLTPFKNQPNFNVWDVHSFFSRCKRAIFKSAIFFSIISHSPNLNVWWGVEIVYHWKAESILYFILNCFFIFQDVNQANITSTRPIDMPFFFLFSKKHALREDFYHSSVQLDSSQGILLEASVDPKQVYQWKGQAEWSDTSTLGLILGTSAIQSKTDWSAVVYSCVTSSNSVILPPSCLLWNYRMIILGYWIVCRICPHFECNSVRSWTNMHLLQRLHFSSDQHYLLVLDTQPF